MRVAVTSDWHGWIPPDIPDCDLMLFAGDLGLGETIADGQIETLMSDWFKFLKGLSMPVVAVAGNHDFPEQVEIMRHMPWTYLEDEMVEINGLKIWGSPWSNPFAYGWAFNMTEEDQEEYWKQVPDDIDIIINHGPPRMGRDTVSYYDPIDGFWVNENVGSEALRKRTTELKNLQLVACGHVHPMYGKSGIVVNGSLVNAKYRIANKPIVIDIKAP